MSSLLSQCTGK
jgi:acyl-CoA reductase-like NAD-dependent aldehyde dehydrogenase